MWIARVWFLVAILVAAVCIAGALTWPSTRDADLAQQVAAVVTNEARLVNAEVAALMADQRRATQLLASDPRLHGTLEQLAPEMPLNVQRALLDKTLKLMGSDHPRLGIALLDPRAIRAVSSSSVGEAVASSAPVTSARGGRLGVGLLPGEPERWVVAAPLLGVKEKFVLATTASPPGTAIARIHETAQLTTRILVQQDDKVVAGSLDAKDHEAAGAAPKVGANGRAPAGEAALSNGAFNAQRFAVPSAPGFSFVLVWPKRSATTLEDAGGLGGILQRALSDTNALLIVLGIALGVWLLGMLLMSRGARTAVRRLSRDLRLLGTDRHSLLDPGAYSSWLRPIIDSANEAAEDSRRQTAKTIALEVPEESEISLDEAEESDEVEAEESEDEAEESDDEESVDTALVSLTSTPPEPPPPEDPEDESETSAEGSGDPTQRAIRTRPKPPVPVKRAAPKPPPSEPLPDELSSSLLDMSLPSLEADDDEHDEGEEPTDAGIELPRSGEPPASKPQGSLLDRLRAQSALDPEAQRFSSGDNTVVKPVPIELLSKSAEADSDRTAVGPPPERPADRDDAERYFRQIFEEFLAVKSRCGERTDNIEFDRFRAKLVRTRKSLTERFECSDVRFRVYVKAGKAALKASPILDD